jgi:hypothetical protein
MKKKIGSKKESPTHRVGDFSLIIMYRELDLLLSLYLYALVARL